MHSLIIHMPQSTARAGNVARLMTDLPNAHVIEAVNGRDPSQIDNVSVHPGTLYEPHYPFTLRAAEIGVFQSNRKCWETIVDAGWDYALIVEDDLAIDPERFARALTMIRRHVSSDSYIRLPLKQREVPSKVVAEDGGLKLILPQVIGQGCVCQVVGRNAAKRLLAASVEIDRPVDTWLQMHWITKQPVHALLGTGNREIADQIGGTTIQQKTHARGWLAREFNRWTYRRALSARKQRPLATQP